MALGPPIAKSIQKDGSMRSAASSSTFHSNVTDLRRSSATDSRRSSATPNSRRGSFAIEESSYPESRRTLVDAVISERSLSYLTETSAMFGNATMVSPSWQQQQHIAAAAAAPPTRKESSNQWRDKYVLKFSGWNKNSNPDRGLPPSLLLGSNQKQQQRLQPSPLRSGADGSSSSSPSPSSWIKGSGNSSTDNVKSDGDRGLPQGGGSNIA